MFISLNFVILDFSEYMKKLLDLSKISQCLVNCLTFISINIHDIFMTFGLHVFFYELSKFEFLEIL